jgi:Capsular polysaccharide synthesis protein
MIIFFVSLFIITIILFIVYASDSSIMYMGNNISMYTGQDEWPKIIWTFWHDAYHIPQVVHMCIRSWMKSNPDYTIILITNENMHDYVTDVPRSHWWKDSHARQADMIRLSVLEKHGGIWIDSSIIINRPFSEWLFNECDSKDKEMYGFYLDSWSVSGKPPVIESWFIACRSRSPFLRKWKEEFYSISQYQSIDDYIQAKKNEIYIDNIRMQHYLAIHISAQKVLQKDGYDRSLLCLLKAEDYAFHYLSINEWNLEKSMGYLCDHVHKYPIMKLTRPEYTFTRKMSLDPINHAESTTLYCKNIDIMIR